MHVLFELLRSKIELGLFLFLVGEEAVLLIRSMVSYVFLSAHCIFMSLAMPNVAGLLSCLLVMDFGCVPS
jgi:hypothetical protein